jgi:hypothetical protein
VIEVIFLADAEADVQAVYEQREVSAKGQGTASCANSIGAPTCWATTLKSVVLTEEYTENCWCPTTHTVFSTPWSPRVWSSWPCLTCAKTRERSKSACAPTNVRGIRAISFPAAGLHDEERERFYAALRALYAFR